LTTKRGKKALGAANDETNADKGFFNPTLGSSPEVNPNHGEFILKNIDHVQSINTNEYVS